MSYSNRVNIHSYYSSSIYYFINFTFANFSLSSPCLTNLATSSLLIFFFFLKCTQTHPHTNTSTQKNQHRDTLAQKKKKHRYTNKPTQTNNKETDWCLIGTIGT